MFLFQAGQFLMAQHSVMWLNACFNYACFFPVKLGYFLLMSYDAAIFTFRPMEVSSKRPVPRFRDVVSVKKLVSVLPFFHWYLM